MQAAPRVSIAGVVLLSLAGLTHEFAPPLPQKRSAQQSQDFLFEAQPHEITAGETAVLRWSIKGATKIVIEEAPGSGGERAPLRVIGSFDGPTGTLAVTPKEDATFVIDCQGSTMYSCASLTVKVRVKHR